MQYLKMSSRQRGMSLIEVIVGTALLGMVLASALVISTRADNETAGRNDADSMASFQQIAGQYFIANRTDIEAAMSGDAAKAAIHCRINVAADGSGGTVVYNAAKYLCAFDSTLLRAKGVWPTGMSVDVAGPGRWVAIVRQVVVAGTPTGNDEMLVVLGASDTSGNLLTSGTATYNGNVRRATEELSAATAALGGTGGFIPPGQDFGPCQYNVTTKQACGPNWVVDLNNFTY